MRDLKRWAIVAAGASLFALAFDAGVGHFAGHDAEHPFWQRVPIILGILGGVVLLLVSLAWEKWGWRRVARAVGGLSVLVGLLGTWFHLYALWKEVKEEGFNWASIEGGLSVAPPLGAPGGFIAIGVLLFIAASVRVRFELAEAGATSTDSPKRPTR